MFKQPFDSRVHKWSFPAVLLASALLVAACGGGGGGGGSSPSATPQTFSTGTISGFGSIVVNGVHYDETRATVKDDDDDEDDDFSSDDLKLGMVVEIEGDDIVRGSSKSTCNASEIVVRSEMKGPVEAVNAGAGTLTVIGQSVVVTVGTVFEDITGGLAGLSVGNLVEVYALLDPNTGVYAASRIERKTNLENYKLRGKVAELNTGAKTFKIGDALISYAQVEADKLPALTNGLLVRVKLLTTQQAGAWVATKVKSGERRLEDRSEAEVEGYVTGFVSLASFKIDGISVDASGSAVIFEDGVAGEVANGVRLEVEGDVVAGVLVARKVEFEREDRDDEDEFELEGPVQAVDLTAGSLTVRGVTVRLTGSTQYDDGSASDLVVGRRVEVKAELLPDGTTLQATEISFDD